MVTPGFSKYVRVEDILKNPYAGAETSLFNMAYNLLNSYYLNALRQQESGMIENVLHHVNLGMYLVFYFVLPVLKGS